MTVVDPAGIGCVCLEAGTGAADSGGARQGAPDGSGFAEVLAEWTTAEGGSNDVRPAARRGLPERPELRDMLDRLARQWAVVADAGMSGRAAVPAVPDGEAGDSPAGQLEPAGDEGRPSPVSEVPVAFMPIVVPPELFLPKPEPAKADQLVAMIGTALPLVQASSASSRRTTAQGSVPSSSALTIAAPAKSTRVLEADEAVGSFAVEDRAVSAQAQPDEGAFDEPRDTELIERARLDRLQPRPGPALHSTTHDAADDPTRTGDSARASSAFVVPARPLRDDAVADGDWISHARRLLQAASLADRQVDLQAGRDDTRATAVESGGALPVVVGAEGGQEVRDARPGSSRGKDVGRAKAVVPGAARGVFVDAVRTAARAVATQLSALGPPADTTPRVPAGESRGHLAAAPAVAVPTAQLTPATNVFPSTPAVELPGDASGSPLDSQLTSQIVQAIRLEWGAEGGDVRLRLRPEYLGELTVSLRVDRGAVTAYLQASTPEVRQWIETHEGVLRQGLALHELRLDRLVVREAAGQEQAPSSGDQSAPRDPRSSARHFQRRRPREHDGPAFEVVV